MSSWRDPTSEDRRPLRRAEVVLSSSAGNSGRPPTMLFILGALLLAVSIGSLYAALESRSTSNSKYLQTSDRLTLLEKKISDATEYRDSDLAIKRELEALHKGISLIQEETQEYVQKIDALETKAKIDSDQSETEIATLRQAIEDLERRIKALEPKRQTPRRLSTQSPE